MSTGRHRHHLSRRAPERLGTAIAEDGLLGISEAQIETGLRRDRTFRARRRIILRPSAAQTAAMAGQPLSVTLPQSAPLHG
jgi:hypothetical protein